MKQNTLRFCAVFILFLITAGLHAQETVPATGGEASGSGGSASYSVGQLVYTTHTGTSGSAAQGVQQPYEISEVTGIPEAEGINLLLSAYPNPASDYLIINVENSDLSTLYFQLYDMQGKLLKGKKISADKTEICTNDLSSGTYFLKVTDNKIEIKSFKIIKN